MAIQVDDPSRLTATLPPQPQNALKVSRDGRAYLDSDCSLPKINAEDVLVKVAHVALNPVDGKSVDMSPTEGAVIGCDFAGTVVVASSSRDDLVIGTLVFGCVFGNNPIRTDNGAFAEYVAVPARLVFRVPSGMPLQSAATLGLGLATVGLALFHGMHLPGKPWSPAEEAVPVLVSGGGTATGSLAIQVLKVSGFKPITTSSSHSFGRLKDLGAVATFDYHSPTCGADIREFTNDNLAFALDCHSDSGSMAICYEAIGSQGGEYMALNPFPLRVHRRRSIRPDWVFMFTQFSQAIPWKRPYYCDPQPEDKTFAIMWYEQVQHLLDGGKIRPSLYREMDGGLAAVVEGMDLLNKGKVAGHKLVYAVGR
ncbi:putative alcohol dehydrogenase [Aureobasidium sp. EXF-10727]|nr:putative alcohol dehydrogenase [Aureobasidium sp. EXF-10727]